jgi:hypothetical protein
MGGNALREARPKRKEKVAMPMEWVDPDDLEDLGLEAYVEAREAQRRRLAARFSPFTRKERK